MALRQRKGDWISLDEDPDLSPNPAYARMMTSLDRDPLELLLDAEFKDALEQAMADLPDAWRIPFVLKDMEGLSLQDIADTLDTTVPAVKAALHRGRSALRDRLADFIEKRAVTPRKQGESS
jgi:RNA polymerase sigma-70 factor (ECF subfamily)